MDVIKSNLILTGCVRQNPSTRLATRKDVEVEVAKWLTGARDRGGGRKARQRREGEETRD